MSFTLRCILQPQPTGLTWDGLRLVKNIHLLDWKKNTTLCIFRSVLWEAVTLMIKLMDFWDHVSDFSVKTKKLMKFWTHNGISYHPWSVNLWLNLSNYLPKNKQTCIIVVIVDMLYLLNVHITICFLLSSIDGFLSYVIHVFIGLFLL